MGVPDPGLCWEVPPFPFHNLPLDHGRGGCLKLISEVIIMCQITAPITPSQTRDSLYHEYLPSKKIRKFVFHIDLSGIALGTSSSSGHITNHGATEHIAKS